MGFAQILDEERRIFEHESQVFDEMRPLCRELDIPLFQPIVRLRLLDRDGQEQLLRQFHSHSLTCNGYNMLVCNCCICGTPDAGNYGQGYLSGKDYTASVKANVANSYLNSYAGVEGANTGYQSVVGSTYYSIRAGTGTNAEALSDYTLQTMIADGGTAGKLEYSASSLTEGWNAGSGYYWGKTSRTLQNDSGGDITVSEIDIMKSCNSAGSFLFEFARDIVSGGQVVVDTEALVVEYEFRHSY